MFPACRRSASTNVGSIATLVAPQILSPTVFANFPAGSPRASLTHPSSSSCPDVATMPALSAITRLGPPFISVSCLIFFCGDKIEYLCSRGDITPRPRKRQHNRRRATFKVGERAGNSQLVLPQSVLPHSRSTPTTVVTERLVFCYPGTGVRRHEPLPLPHHKQRRCPGSPYTSLHISGAEEILRVFPHFWCILCPASHHTAE